MRPKVKICGLKKPADAQYVNDAGADYAGFVFYEKSRRNLSRQQAEEIMIRLNRVGKIFHPFSDQFCDLNGIARLLRGLHPNLGTQEKGYVKIIEKQ